MPVFRNGKLLRKWDFSELIERSERVVPEHWYHEAVAPMHESFGASQAAGNGAAVPAGV